MSDHSEDPMRQRPAHAASELTRVGAGMYRPDEFIPFSQAVREANEEPAEENVTVLQYLSFLLSRTARGFVRIIHLISCCGSFLMRGLLFVLRWNPNKYRHILSTAYTDHRVLNANVEMATGARMKLGPGCWLSELTLAFTYHDVCGFCGSPMKNSLSTPAQIEGVVVEAAPPGWEENMGFRQRVLLICLEILTFSAIPYSIAAAILTFVRHSSETDSYQSLAVGTIGAYWLVFWQPRLGLLTLWGVLGRFLIQWMVVWIAISSAMSWGMAFVLTGFMFRIAIPM